ncbi:MAG: M20/M25/M40 family metallo-hydrolase [Hydrogenoanaerobacterium sp.]
MTELIRRLSLLRGVSGDEGAVAQAITEEIKTCCDYSIDNLGNIIAFKKGKKPAPKKLMLAAHMDEVGFIVTYITEKGFLRFATVGGIDGRVVAGKAVLVGKKAVYGVIGERATHMVESTDKDKVPETEALFIDIGAGSREEAEKMVSVGDRAVYASDFAEFGEGFIKGRALDDRAGCAVLIELIKSELLYDTYFAFTVQEETGTVGAKAAAFAVKPDISLVIEATTAADIAGVPKDRQVCRLGAGAVIGFMDRATVYDSTLYNIALDTAKKCGIAAQSKEGVFGGNDSRSIQSSCAGVRCLAVSMPCRYLHSPSCVLKISDIEATFALAKELCTEVYNA